MILLLFIFSAKVRASCSFFNVECQTSGALISLVSTCRAAMNSSDEIVNSNLTDLFLTSSLENQTIASDCALSNHQVFEYSKCFSANAHAGTSLNYTSQIVKAVEVGNVYVFVAVVEEILCEPAIDVQHDKKAFLISAPSSNGAIPNHSPTASIKLSGGKTLGAFVTASIEAANDEFYSKEFGDCNVTSGELTVELLKNGEITSDGSRLRAELESPDSLRFIRFSKRSDIATAFDVQCSIRWRSKTASETTTTAAALSPSNTYIMVILGTLSDSFIINGDGTSVSSVQISTPGNTNDYTISAKSAIVSDKLYIFGGDGVGTSYRKIARLDSCSFVELAVRLNVDFAWGHSTLSISNGSEALICFEPEDSSKSCDIFDGAAVESTHSSNRQHRSAALGFYKGQPTVVGGRKQWWSERVETKGETGWTELTFFPYALRAYNLVGLDNGDLLLIGGEKYGDFTSMIFPVWRLSNDIWSEEERLHKSFARGSTIKIENHIYSFGGFSNAHEEFPMQRIDLKEDNMIESLSVIGNHAQYYKNPILFKTERNSCTTS